MCKHRISKRHRMQTSLIQHWFARKIRNRIIKGDHRPTLHETNLLKRFIPRPIMHRRNRIFTEEIQALMHFLRDSKFDAIQRKIFFDGWQYQHLYHHFHSALFITVDDADHNIANMIHCCNQHLPACDNLTTMHSIELLSVCNRSCFMITQRWNLGVTSQRESPLTNEVRRENKL